MKRALAVVLLGACLVAADARADGDPASDYLLAQQVFLPFDAKLPQTKQRKLISIVQAANKGGYTIRVALIWSSYDLGAITPLWRKPRTYARFLGEELQFVYKERLLIVMPNGFGFNWPGHPTDKEYALLQTIPIGSGPVGLLEAGGAAVQKLAAASGVEVTAGGPGSSHSNARDRIVIILASTAALAVAVLLRLALRGRRPKRT